jgi:DNA helicase-2/ATP-dependent DNA helicase PcrA
MELNDRQREAVEATEGPVLVIAGAGSGKTRVLTERIAHLVKSKGTPPRDILAFTFTNRAAREMKERLETTHPGISQELWVGTFHATGVRILRRHGSRVGIERHFSIYDANDSLDLVKECISRRALEGSILRSPMSIRDQISRWKNDLISPRMAFERVSNNIERRIASVYHEYEDGLKRANALDFDDLIARVVELLSADPDTQRYYARRFSYVLVDEFQDTNPIQMVPRSTAICS